MTSVLKVDNIQNSSGTSALSIDSNGNVASNNHYIGIYKNGNQAGTNQTWTKITGWTVEGNGGLTWDSTDNEIDVAKAGSYFVNFQAQIFSSSNDIGQVWLKVYKNGSHLFGSYNMAMNGANTANPFDPRHWTCNVSNVVKLAENDSLSFYFYATATTPTIFDGDATGGERATNVSMMRLGD